MSTIDNLPPLRDVIETHELRARKSLAATCWKSAPAPAV